MGHKGLKVTMRFMKGGLSAKIEEALVVATLGQGRQFHGNLNHGIIYFDHLLGIQKHKSVCIEKKFTSPSLYVMSRFTI